MMDATISKVDAVLPVTQLCVDYSHSPPLLYAAVGGDFMVHTLGRKADVVARIAVFDSHSIHGIRKYGEFVYCFGGKAIKIYRVHASGSCSNVRLEGFEMELMASFETLDDLILDLLPIPGCDLLLVGYGHNFIDIVSQRDALQSRFRKLCRIHCPSTICTLFSMTFDPSSTASKICIASGTVFGKLIVWQVNINEDKLCADARILNTFSDHEGVIFKIVWERNERGTLLASVSDDRTVRVWDLQRCEQVCTGWGHVNRVWDVAFIDSERFATCSEDSTIKIWNYEGSCLSTLRGHSEDVWRLIFLPLHDKYLVSGGNDGSVKIWRIEAHLACTAEDPTRSTLVIIPDWHDSNDVNNRRNITTTSSIALDDEKSVQAPLGNAEISTDAPAIDHHAGTPNPNPNRGQFSDALPELDHDEVKQKPKVSESSRKSNGVSAVNLSPDGAIAILYLVDGGIWAKNMRIKSPSAKQSNTSAWHWTPVIRMNKTITVAGTSFLGSMSTSSDLENVIAVHSLVAHPDGSMSLLHFSCDTITGSIHISANMSWQSHSTRAVNLWFLSSDPHDNFLSASEIFLSASARGICRLWTFDTASEMHTLSNCTGDSSAHGDDSKTGPALREPTSAELPHMLCDFVTGKEQIATSCFLSSCRLFVGDSRGGISIYSLAALVKKPSHGMQVSCSQYLFGVHGQTPVSCLRSHMSGFCSAGHDGYYCVYRDVYSLPYPQPDSEPHERSAYQTTNYDKRSLFQYSMINRLSCLPVKTPDRIYSLNDRCTHVGNKDNGKFYRSDQCYVGGYTGSLYIVWDLQRGYEVLRVEGGGWRRPHDCVLSIAFSSPSSMLSKQLTASTSLAAPDRKDSTYGMQCTASSIDTQIFPRAVFVCPEAIQKQMHLSIFDNEDENAAAIEPDGASNPQPNPDGASDEMVPMQLGVSGLGRVSNCTNILCRSSRLQAERSQLVLVGGENGFVKLYAVDYSGLGNSCRLIQEVQMPSLVAAKCIASAHNDQTKVTPRYKVGACKPDDNSASRKALMGIDGDWGGIVVVVGGRLSYGLWSYDLRYDTDVLSLSCSGKVQPNASQDHRILSGTTALLDWNVDSEDDTYLSKEDKGNSKHGIPRYIVNRYVILMGDSRGIVTTALHTQQWVMSRSPEKMVETSGSPQDCGSFDTHGTVEGKEMHESVASTNAKLDDCNTSKPPNSQDVHQKLLQKRRELKELSIVHMTPVSSYPILCSAMTTVSPYDSRWTYVFGFFGDTNGDVSVWLMLVYDRHADSDMLASPSPSSSSTSNPRRLGGYSPHDMGVNTISMEILPEFARTVGDSSSESGQPSMYATYEFLSVTGGDDQAISICRGALCFDTPPDADSDSQSYATTVSLAMHDAVRSEGQAGSAVKSIELASKPSKRSSSHCSSTSDASEAPNVGSCCTTRSYYVFSVGYDQRMTVNKISDDFISCKDTSRARSDPEDPVECKVRVEKPSVERRANVNSSIVNSSTPALQWVSGAVVNVGDVADMHIRECATLCHANQNGCHGESMSENVDSETRIFDISVTGEGVQFLSSRL